MSRLKDIKQRYPNLAVDSLADADPSGSHKYLGWMACCVAGGASAEEVEQEICRFHASVQRLPPQQRSISSFPDLPSLRQTLDALGDSKRKKKRKARRAGAEVVFENKRVVVWKINSFEGMEVHGRNTRWCVTNRGTYRSYTRHSVFYVVTDKKAKVRDRNSKFAVRGFVPARRKRKAFGFLPYKKVREYAAEKDPLESIIRFSVTNAADFTDKKHKAHVEKLVGKGKIKSILLADQRIIENVGGALENMRRMHELARRVPPPGASIRAVLKLAEEIAKEPYSFAVGSLFDHPRFRDPHPRSLEHLGRLWELQEQQIAAGYKMKYGAIKAIAETPAKAVPAFASFAVETIKREVRNRFTPWLLLTHVFNPKGHSPESLEIIKTYARRAGSDVAGRFLLSSLCTKADLARLEGRVSLRDWYRSARHGTDLDHIVTRDYITLYYLGPGRIQGINRYRYQVCSGLAANRAMTPVLLRRLSRMLKDLGLWPSEVRFLRHKIRSNPKWEKRRR